MNKVDPKYNDMKIVKKDLKNGMIKGILEYIENGIFPNINSNSYINVYTKISSVADIG